MQTKSPPGLSTSLHNSMANSARYMERGWSLFLAFSQEYETVSEEYQIYDFNGIVSAVGGGLGLFLGFSCFSLASALVSRAARVLSYVGGGSQIKSSEKWEDKIETRK